VKLVLKRLLLIAKKPIDILLSIIIILPAYLMLFFRRFGAKRLPITSKVLKFIGVWPIRDHYYEPLFNSRHLSSHTDMARFLPGLDMKIDNQLLFLKNLRAANDFITFVEAEKKSTNSNQFKIDNNSFKAGDSDFLYQFIRHTKPKKIIEIGSGNSTIIAQNALLANQLIDNVNFQHICIEPYEQDWLEQYSGIELVRNKVEQYNTSWANVLEPGDLLFIDSSHMIRPQGDVLYEYLNILPQLKSGVFVHVHDIFTPRDYLKSWLKDDVLFWNEQYLLEGILSNSTRYEVIAALNHLKHSHFEQLKAVCPFLTSDDEPGSFYFKVC
jgi:predicted O-methyltransferase YrrM